MICRSHLLQRHPHSGDAQVSGGHEDTGPAAVMAYEFQGSRLYSNCCYAMMSEMVTRASRLMLPFKPLLMATPDDKGPLSWSASLDAVGSLLCGVLWSKFETLGWSVVQMELLTQKGLFNIESES